MVLEQFTGFLASYISKIIERVVKSRLTKMRTFEVFLVFKNLKT